MTSLRLELVEDRDEQEVRPRAGSHGTPLCSNAEAAEISSETGDLEKRDFEKKLFSLITTSFKLEKAVKYRHRMMEMMRNYTDRLGITGAVSKLPVVHVAGTKGKGSTCAFVESILRSHGLRTGLFTSPHLVDVTERFCIDGLSVSRETMLRTFFFVWDRLHETKADAKDFPPIPSFFRFLTLVGFKIFMDANVDVVVLEVGMGGRLDATNVVSPVVCGITPLDLDHTRILGDTIEKIAYEKAGIMKPGVPCFTGVGQESGAMQVLKDVAKKAKTSSFTVVEPIAADSQIITGLKGTHQRENGALAVALSRKFLEYHSRNKRKLSQDSENTKEERARPTADGVVFDLLPSPTKESLGKNTERGLARCEWAGRTQTLEMPGGWGKRSKVSFHLDGAHTPKSMECCISWFQNIVDAAPKGQKQLSVLVFNCSHERRVETMFRRLQQVCAFDQVIFCPADYARPSSIKYPSAQSLLDKLGVDGGRMGSVDVDKNDHKWQHIMSDVWNAIVSRGTAPKSSLSKVMPSVSDTVDHLKEYAAAQRGEDCSVNILFTGSLFLVGSALNKLGWKPRGSNDKKIGLGQGIDFSAKKV